MPTNAIVTWFNPGRNSGHEFVYSRSEDQELARAKQQTISAMEPSKHQFVVVEPRSASENSSLFLLNSLEKECRCVRIIWNHGENLPMLPS
jgi:hypothetical protein